MVVPSPEKKADIGSIKTNALPWNVSFLAPLDKAQIKAQLIL